MRISISLILLIVSIPTFSQRVTFEDPDLTFSFKKPKKWQVFDDGYVVKVSPSAKDSAQVYFTITYFENAQPVGLFPSAQPANSVEEVIFEKIKIDGEYARRSEKSENDTHQQHYTFMKYGQRFEINTSAQSEETNRIFRKIIRSIQIKN